eukprot:1185360-Prorocentrum_minimum.AAC.1
MHSCQTALSCLHLGGHELISAQAGGGPMWNKGFACWPRTLLRSSTVTKESFFPVAGMNLRPMQVCCVPYGYRPRSCRSVNTLGYSLSRC